MRSNIVRLQARCKQIDNCVIERLSRTKKSYVRLKYKFLEESLLCWNDYEVVLQFHLLGWAWGETAKLRIQNCCVVTSLHSHNSYN